MMADLRRLAELARAEHYGTITPNQAAALAELRARANQRGQTLSQFVSPLLTIGTAMVAEPVSGLAGIAGTVLPGEPGQGARWVEGTREALTYYPKDEAGQRGVQAVGDFFQPVSETMDRVTQTAGDAGYRMGGPLLGAAAATVPTAISELAGIGKPARAVSVMDNISDAARGARISPNDADVYFHTSPGPISEINDLGRFGDNLFFSEQPYQMTQAANPRTYMTRFEPGEIIDADTIPFTELSSGQRSIYDRYINDVANKLGTDDLDLAEDILTERKDLFEVIDDLDIDPADAGEISWDLQAMLGGLGRDLGYKAVRATDEQGPVLIAPMKGRDADLIEVDEGVGE